jgi:hypothetical protein
MEKITECNRNFKLILYGFGCISLFSAVILYNLEFFSIVYKILIWLILVCLPYYIGYYIMKNLNKILIDENNCTISLIFRKFDFKIFKFIELSEIYKIPEISFSYKYHRTSKGSRYKRLDIFYKKIKLSQFGLAYDGWDEIIIIEIVTKLNELGAKQILEY